jgi:cell division protein FtsL
MTVWALIKHSKFAAWIAYRRAIWFPEDPISLRQVLRQTFWVESAKPVVRRVLAIFVSALILVLVKNAYHQAFMKLQALEAEQEAAHTEWMQLLIEEGTWGNHDRIYQIATTNMKMNMPTPFNTKLIVVPNTPGFTLNRLTEHSLLGEPMWGKEGYLPHG